MRKKVTRVKLKSEASDAGWEKVDAVVAKSVEYRYAFNTQEEVEVLRRYYCGLINHAGNSDEVIKYVNRILFLEKQLTMAKDPTYG